MDVASQPLRNGDTVMVINPGGISTSILLAATFFAYPCALLFGVPALLALRRANWLGIAPVTVTGAVMAMTWLSILIVLNVVADTPSAAASSAGVDAGITPSDLFLATRLASAFGVLGGIGGVVFWVLAIADWRRPSGQSDPTPQS